MFETNTGCWVVEERKSSLDGLSLEDILFKENEENLGYGVLDKSIINWITLEEDMIPTISNELTLKDKFNIVVQRLGFNRKEYKVPSGLYGVGDPNENSDVFVTCNYKYSFDCVRVGLKGENAWILVLDTKGINVWCAAGKGTFSSRELIYQLNKWNLKDIVDHRTVIVPQLGATQMEPHLVKKYSEFNVVYGPIRSEDLVEYIKNGKVADEKMRTVTFTLKDRMILAPVEINHSIKYLIIISLFFYIINLVSGEQNINLILKQEVISIVYAILGGTVLFPALLPILPFSSFSMKGAFLGTVMSLFVYGNKFIGSTTIGNMYNVGMVLGIILIVSILGLVFTGSTTYTSFSGVDYETKKSIPIFIISGIISVLLVTISKFL